jgi:hypothetical protein
MWQTDTVIFQVEAKTNVYGSIVITYTDGISVTCDVQDINKEFAFERFGISTSTELKQVFDHTLANWKVGSQVKFNALNWWVKLVEKQTKIGASNHIYVILERVS